MAATSMKRRASADPVSVPLLYTHGALGIPGAHALSQARPPPVLPHGRYLSVSLAGPGVGRLWRAKQGLPGLALAVGNEYDR